MNFATTFTPTDLSSLFLRLRSVYGLKGAWALRDESSEEAKVFRNEWWRLLKHVTTEEAEQAVDLWASGTKDRWPTPGELYGSIMDRRPKREAPMKSGRQRCACGDPSCDLRPYRLPSGVTRLVMDCVARERGLELSR